MIECILFFFCQRQAWDFILLISWLSRLLRFHPLWQLLPTYIETHRSYRDRNKSTFVVSQKLIKHHITAAEKTVELAFSEHRSFFPTVDTRSSSSNRWRLPASSTAVEVFSSWVEILGRHCGGAATAESGFLQR